ncbi:hypothetical protein lbkm_4105 [Lachnospiraceae bacterium KM106-2]|nr:hypothetical protein lbkm_4105 [Lachnospiraceae bacterium KM106-2]
MKQSFGKDLYIDLAASFVFSMGVGWVFVQTESVFYGMIAHFCERVLSRTIHFHHERSIK